jgi:hypothetical protein
MTAHDLIDSIFSRPPWLGMPGNIRHLTPDQLDFLLKLIGKDEEGGAVQWGTGRSLVWTPSGRHKYIVTEDPGGRKHTLTRLANSVASESGRLFS